MLRFPALALAVFASAFIQGCGEESPPSAPRTIPLPSFRTENNAEGPGAFVFRFDGTFGFADLVPNTEFSYMFGPTLEEFAKQCANEEFLAGPFDDQQVLRPDESIHDVFRARDLPLAAWNTNTHPRDFCSVPPFALGTAQILSTDNDLTFSEHRTDAFGFRIHGTVTALEGGQRYRLWQKLHFTVLKTGEIIVASEEWKFFPVGP
jgi:hypothetical protein